MVSFEHYLVKEDVRSDDAQSVSQLCCMLNLLVGFTVELSNMMPKSGTLE